MNLSPKTRSTILLATASLLLASFGHAAFLGFESGEGFAANSDVATATGWTKSTPGAAKISSGEAQSGQQSLKIAASKSEAAATTTFPIPDDGIIFLDFAILPTADGSKAPLSTIDANGAVLGFLVAQDQGRIVTLTATGDKGGAPNVVEAGHPFTVDEQNLATDWMRLTIRENLKVGKWDLYVDGRLAVIDQPLLGKAQGKSGSLSFEASPAGAIYADDLTITTANPLFPDADKDGIPDAVEMVEGTNLYYDDRDADFNGNSKSNARNFLAGSSMGATRTSESAARVIYVDNIHGNDTNTGALPYTAGGDGPLRTLLGAFQKANDLTTVAILPSTTAYDWPEKIPSHLTKINTFPVEAINVK